MASICCDCKTKNRDSATVCSNCGSSDNFVSARFINEEVYIDGKIKGKIIGTAQLYRDGIHNNLWIVQTEIDFIAPLNGGQTNLIVVNGENLTDEYIGE